jgi:hypothetical protein
MVKEFKIPLFPPFSKGDDSKKGRENFASFGGTENSASFQYEFPLFGKEGLGEIFLSELSI